MKFAALAELTLKRSAWIEGPNGWREPFLPEQRRYLGISFVAAWHDISSSPAPGVKPGSDVGDCAGRLGRLKPRWRELTASKPMLRAEQAIFPRRMLRSESGDDCHNTAWSQHSTRPGKYINDDDELVPPVPYAFRTLDRQWIAAGSSVDQSRAADSCGMRTRTARFF